MGKHHKPRSQYENMRSNSQSGWRGESRNGSSHPYRRHPAMVNTGDIHIHIHVNEKSGIPQSMLGCNIEDITNVLSALTGNAAEPPKNRPAKTSAPDFASMNPYEMLKSFEKMQADSVSTASHFKNEINDLSKQINVAKAEGKNTADLESKINEKTERLELLESLLSIGSKSISNMKRDLEKLESSTAPPKSSGNEGSSRSPAPDIDAFMSNPNINASAIFGSAFKPTGNIKEDMKEMMGVDIDKLPPELSDQLNSLIKTMDVMAKSGNVNVHEE